MPRPYEHFAASFCTNSTITVGGFAPAAAFTSPVISTFAPTNGEN